MFLGSHHKKLCQLQLLKEHEHICWQNRIKMSPPVIRISNSRRILGEWCSEKRQISISEYLIQNYSWDCVVNVLKHEMAHQMVYDLYEIYNEKPHGESFYRACDQIACPGIFRTPFGDLPEGERLWSKEELPKDYEEVLNKVDKLLSLANSDNESEALLAMEKAQSLQQKYNLKQLDFLSVEKYRYKIIEIKKKRISLQQSLIASILQEFYMVKVIHSDLFYANKLESYKTIEIIGTKENVYNANYIYYFLLNKIDQLWKSYQKETGALGREKRSYQYGLLKGFKNKIEKSQAPKNEHIRALIVKNEHYLNHYTSKRFPRLTKAYGSHSNIDSFTYENGFLDGGKIVISKGLSEKVGNLGRLLTGSK